MRLQSRRSDRCLTPLVRRNMLIHFPGTRANIDIESVWHRRHSVLLVSAGRTRLLVDCGADWLGRLDALKPHAVLITHAHPDHVGGLRRGSPCPVWATPATWGALHHMPIVERRILRCGHRHRFGTLSVYPVRVVHSRRCPTVAFRITAGRRTIFYAPDVLSIPLVSTALKGVDLFIGDGSSISRPIVRGRSHLRSGHASIKTQLGWCAREAVRCAIFTHCSAALVRLRWDAASSLICALGHEHEIDARIAYDGLTVRLR